MSVTDFRRREFIGLGVEVLESTCAEYVGIKGKVAMSGGVAKNIGMVKALEKRVGEKLLIGEEPQIIGALGAALTAAERALRSPQK